MHQTNNNKNWQGFSIACHLKLSLAKPPPSPNNIGIHQSNNHRYLIDINNIILIRGGLKTAFFNGFQTM